MPGNTVFLSKLHKMRFMRQNPLTYQLWVRILKEPRHPAHARAMNLQSALLHQFTGDWQSVFPQDKLRPGLTWQHVWDILAWIGLGLQEKFMALIPDVVDEGLEQSCQSMIDELNVYLDILQSGIYREVHS